MADFSVVRFPISYGAWQRGTSRVGTRARHDMSPRQGRLAAPHTPVGSPHLVAAYQGRVTDLGPLLEITRLYIERCGLEGYVADSVRIQNILWLQGHADTAADSLHF